MRNVFLVGVPPTLSAQRKAPKIWDDKALENWATPIAALGVHPDHFASAEYLSAPAEISRPTQMRTRLLMIAIALALPPQRNFRGSGMTATLRCGVLMHSKAGDNR